MGFAEFATEPTSGTGDGGLFARGPRAAGGVPAAADRGGLRAEPRALPGVSEGAEGDGVGCGGLRG